MKKVLIFTLSVLLMMSSCGTYTGAGAFTGAHFGSVVGSAIGGISGGWRGHHVGTLIGLAGGAAVGAAIGAAADNAATERRMQRYEANRSENARQRSADDSGFDPQMRGDDRITFDGGAGSSVRSNLLSTGPVLLEISNVRLVDNSHDGQLARGEAARMVFEITNKSKETVYSVQPSVQEVSGNKHVHISENILVECMRPGETIRYTAQIKADNRLRNGEAVIRVGVFQAGREITSQTRDYPIRTFKQ